MKKIQKYYDKFSKKYDLQRDSAYYQMIEQIEKSIIKKHLREKGLVLDLACGSGRFVALLQKKERTIVGVDISMDMLKIAKEKNNNAFFVLADAISLPFKNNTFTHTISLKALPHIPQLKKALKEIGRVTKKEAVLEFYNCHSLKRLAFPFYHKSTIFTRFVSLKEIKSTLKESGFETKAQYGARTITPFSFVFHIPILRKIFQIIEWKVHDSFLNRFAGNIILVAKRSTKKGKK